MDELMARLPPKHARVVDAPVPTIPKIMEEMDRAARAMESRLARLVPSAFWLKDHGDDSTQDEPKCEEAPVCPTACDAPVLVIQECAGQATMWSCTLCGIDYDAKGRTGLRGLLARSSYERSLRRARASRMREEMRREMGRE